MILAGVSGAWAHRYVPKTRATSLEVGKSYIIYNTAYTPGSYVDRRFYVYGNGTSIASNCRAGSAAAPSSFVTTNADYLWKLEDAGDGKYYLKNHNGNYYNGGQSLSSGSKVGLYIINWSSSDNDAFQASCQSEDASGTMREEGGYGNANDVWTISTITTGLTNSDAWNGNSGTSGFATWKYAHPYAFYEVEIVADIEEWGYRIYTLYDGSSETEGSTPYYLTSTGTLTATPGEAEIFQFTKTTSNGIVPAGYAYKVNGQTSGKRFTNPNGENRTNNIRVDTQNRDSYEAQIFYLNDTDDGTYAVRASNVNDNTWHANAYWNVEDNGNTLPDADYGLQDEKHFVWRLEKMVQYNLVFDESTLDTYYQPRVEGSASLPTTNWQRDFCTYSYSPSTVGSSTETVSVTMTWGGPFDISPNYNNATWYILHMRQGGYNVKYADDAESYSLVATSSFTNENGYYWAFTGNPYNGFQIWNRGAGNSKTLYAGSANPANGSYPLMNESNTTRWIVNGNPKNSEANAFGLQVPGTSRYINDYAGYKKLSFWQDNASKDAGSTLTVEAPYPIWVEENISPYFDNFGKYFSVKSSSESMAMGSTWAAAKSSCDKATYDELLAFVSDANNIRYPATGNYRIKNVSSGKYVGYGTAGYTGKGVGLIEVEASDPSSILQLTKVSDGVYTISTQGLNVQTQGDNNTPVRANSNAGSNHTFTMQTPTVVSIRADLSDANGYWFRSSWGNAPESILTWDNSSNASKWVIEDATNITLTLNAVDDVTYGTTYLPFGVTLPTTDATGDDVCAYTLINLGNGWVRPVLLGTDGKSIPAGTPVLLKGTSTTNVTATIASVDDISQDNILDGTYTTMAHGDNLVLGKYDGVVGFYKYNFDIKPNKAYIAADAEVKGFMLSWDNISTSIEDNVGMPESQSQTIYNISGQRVSQPTRGIYIVNGRKMVVK